MQYQKITLAAVVLAGVMLPTHAAPHTSIAAPRINPAKAAPQAAAGSVSGPIKTSLDEDRAAERGRIAMCANMAALRGASARTSGADYATQNRVLELSFVLCMSGAQTRD